MVALRLIGFSFHKAGVGFVISEYKASTVPKQSVENRLNMGGFFGKSAEKDDQSRLFFVHSPEKMFGNRIKERTGGDLQS